MEWRKTLPNHHNLKGGETMAAWIIEPFLLSAIVGLTYAVLSVGRK
jgi:hypothetical protein